MKQRDMDFMCRFAAAVVLPFIAGFAQVFRMPDAGDNGNISPQLR